MVCGSGSLVEWVLEVLVLRRLSPIDPKLAWSPGATASPSNASRAEDNSPQSLKSVHAPPFA